MRKLRSEDALKIILRPYITEKTFDLIEKENKLTFIVDDMAGKNKIKIAVKVLYNVDIQSVNTVKTISGKKAYVKLSKDKAAADLASKIGLV